MAYRFADDLETKARRIRDGGPIRCLDIFSGMGGWSLGFRAAGGLIVGGIDINHVAAAFHHKLFGPVNPAKDGEVGPYDQDSDPCDITSADEFRVAADYAPVDVLIASPPCQAWSRIGRARLRQLFGGTEEHREQDHRFGLHREIGRLTAALRPLAVVAENVPDAARSFPEIAQDLDSLGYTVRWTLLNAAHFGTPQLRPRLYLIAVHAGAIRVVPKFPEPTTRWALTEGYGNIATFVSKTDCAHFTQPPKPRKGLPLAPTVSAALDDLPSLDGSRIPSPPSAYALSLGAGTVTVTDHVGRPTSDRDRRIIDGMRPDDNKIDAWNNIEHLADEEIKRLGLRGADAEALRRSWIPPWNGRERRTHRDHWRRLDGEKPSVVLVSHLDTDSFSHIHHSEARTITIREAARLQGIPDSVGFDDVSLSSAFGMIGNGVAVPVGRAIAETLLSQIRAACAGPAVVVLDGKGDGACVVKPRDRFAEMIARRWWPLSAAVAAASHPDLFAKPQRYADAMLERRRAGIPDMTAEQAAAHGLVMVECRVTWMRGTFRGWIGREREAELPAILAGINGPVKAAAE